MIFTSVNVTVTTGDDGHNGTVGICKTAVFVILTAIAHQALVRAIDKLNGSVKGRSVVSTQGDEGCSNRLSGILAIEVATAYNVDGMTVFAINKACIPEALVRIETVERAIQEVHILSTVGAHDSPILGIANINAVGKTFKVDIGRVSYGEVVSTHCNGSRSGRLSLVVGCMSIKITIYRVAVIRISECEEAAVGITVTKLHICIVAISRGGKIRLGNYLMIKVLYGYVAPLDSQSSSVCHVLIFITGLCDNLAGITFKVAVLHRYGSLVCSANCDKLNSVSAYYFKLKTVIKYLIACYEVPNNGGILVERSVGVNDNNIAPILTGRDVRTVTDIVLMIISDLNEARSLDELCKPRNGSITETELDIITEHCFKLRRIIGNSLILGNEGEYMATLSMHFGSSIVEVEGCTVEVNVGLHGNGARYSVYVISCIRSVTHYLLTALVSKYVRIIDSLEVLCLTVTDRTELRVVNYVYGIGLVIALAYGEVTDSVENAIISYMAECGINSVFIRTFDDKVLIRVNVSAEAGSTCIVYHLNGEYVLSLGDLILVYLFKPISRCRIKILAETVNARVRPAVRITYENVVGKINAAYLDGLDEILSLLKFLVASLESKLVHFLSLACKLNNVLYKVIESGLGLLGATAADKHLVINYFNNVTVCTVIPCVKHVLFVSVLNTRSYDYLAVSLFRTVINLLFNVYSDILKIGNESLNRLSRRSVCTRCNNYLEVCLTARDKNKLLGILIAVIGGIYLAGAAIVIATAIIRALFAAGSKGKYHCHRQHKEKKLQNCVFHSLPLI